MTKSTRLIIFKLNMWSKLAGIFSLSERNDFSVVNARENRLGYGSLSYIFTSEIYSVGKILCSVFSVNRFWSDCVTSFCANVFSELSF